MPSFMLDYPASIFSTLNSYGISSLTSGCSFSKPTSKCSYDVSPNKKWSDGYTKNIKKRKNTHPLGLPYTARLCFLKYIFRTFYESKDSTVGCKIEGFWEGTWMSETIQQVKHLFEFGSNSIVRGGLFCLDSCTHLPACMQGSEQTHRPRCRAYRVAMHVFRW